MGSSSGLFRTATAVTSVGDDRWDAEIAEGWDILGNANGGYLLAMASRASSEATGGRVPVTISGHFTRPGRAGPVVVMTDVVRTGRRLSVVRSRMTQGDNVLLEALGTFSEPPDKQPEILLSDAVPAALPPPEECVQAVHDGSAPFPPPLMNKIDLRASPRLAGMFTTGPYGEAALEGWFNLRDGEPLDPHALVLASDSFPPTAFTAGLPVGWTPTIELTVHIRNPNAQGWIRSEIKSRFVSGGFIEEDGLFWDESETLVAQSRQLALVATT
jgi:acyl-CoA thioesterase